MLPCSISFGAGSQRAAPAPGAVCKETCALRGRTPRIGSHISHAALSKATVQAEPAATSSPMYSAEVVSGHHHHDHELSLSQAKSAALKARSSELRPDASNDPKHLEQLAVSVLSSSSLWNAGRSVSAADDDKPSTSASAYELARGVGNLAKAGKLDEAVRLVEELSKQNRSDVLQLVSQRYFMQHARQFKGSVHAHAFLQALPKRFACAKTFNMVLQVCAASRDIQTANLVMNLLDKRQMKPDSKLLTSLINVCRSVGQADRAYTVFLQMKQDKLQLDAQVYGALLAAFAEAMQRELTVAHERKDQYVLLEKAFSVIKEAEAAHIRLPVIAWNSLLSACGRCGQLKRAFEVLEMMQSQGIQPDAISYGSIIEGCVHAKRPELALRLFERALNEGHTLHVELYTQAVSACKLEGNIDMDAALGIYATMQRNNVGPDKKFYSAMIAVAGRAGRLEQGFEILEDMAAEGIPPTRTVCSGLMYACSISGLPELSRKVYDLCAAHGVYPELSQYNRLMDWYAGERHLGDVVSLLSDMTQRARHRPNLNTYRILLNACQKAEQGALAFEVFSVMKAQRVPVLQEKFAITLYYTLIKACFNQQRHLWGARHGAAQPVVRMAEAEMMLVALGSSLSARSKGSLLLQDATPATWAQYAVSAYRDLVAHGWKPTLDILDMLMGCLRMPLDKRSSTLQKEQQPGSQHAPDATAPQPPQAAAAQAAQQPARGDGARYEATFDRRAVPLLEDAIGRGFLPAFTVDQACTVDLRMMPPTLAEVYTLTIMTSLERRAARLRSAAAADNMQVSWAAATNTANAGLFFHRVTLLVPPFNPELALWPSSVPKLNSHLSSKERPAQQPTHTTAPQSDSPAHHSNSNSQTSASSQHLTAATDAAHAGSAAQNSAEVLSPATQPLIHHVDLAQHAVAQHALPQHAVLQEHHLEAGNLHSGSAPQPEVHPEVSFMVDASHEATSSMEDSSTESDMEHTEALEGEFAADAATSLAVAATCRRLKMYAGMNHTRGVISLEPGEVAKWIKAKRTWELRQTGQLPTHGAPQGAAQVASRAAAQAAGAHVPEPPAQGSSESAHMVGTLKPGTYGSALMEQQRRIRTGLVAPTSTDTSSKYTQGAFSAPLIPPGAPNSKHPVQPVPPSISLQQARHAASARAAGTDGNGAGASSNSSSSGTVHVASQ